MTSSTTNPAKQNPTAGGAPAMVKSAERAIEILEILGEAVEPMSVAELHRRTGYPRSSLHHLLHTLAAKHWVEYEPDTFGVTIGTRALLTGTSYLDRDPALLHGQRTLEAVRERTGWTSHYARRDGTNVIYLATREATDSHRLTSRVGRQLPAHATGLGKALLAELSPGEVADLLGAGPLAALTEATLSRLDALTADLDRTRQRGWAVEREENTTGLACCAAAVPYRIPATDAVSCSIPLEHADEAELARVGAILAEEVARLGRTLRAEGIR